MTSVLNIFFLVFAAIFPVVNPPGSALVFLGLTREAAHETRRILAWRVARNSFFVLVCSFFLGALVLKVLWNIDTGASRGWRLHRRRSRMEASQRGQSKGTGNLGG